MFGGQAVVGHRGAIPRSSVFCAGVVTAVDVGDGSVAETDEVVDRLPGADRVVVADDIDRASGDASTHFDDRYLFDERFEVAGMQFGAHDDEACAAVAQQLVHHRVLSAAGGEGSQEQVVAQLLRGRVHVLDQFDLEWASQREQHSQGATAVASQALGE